MGSTQRILHISLERAFKCGVVSRGKKLTTFQGGCLIASKSREYCAQV